MNVREVLNAIFYVLWTGCQWKALPKDLPPRSTVWEYLDLWQWDGRLCHVNRSEVTKIQMVGLVRPQRSQSARHLPPRT